MTPGGLLGVVTGVGSLVFLVAAFLPISRVYATPGAQAKRELIASSPAAWRISQVLFALGAAMTAAGAGLVVLIADLPWPGLLRWVPLALLGVGAMPSRWLSSNSAARDPRPTLPTVTARGRRSWTSGEP